MTLGGLFSGIGGFELAAQWAGITPVWSNEIDPFCCKVLRKNFKHEIIEGDIRELHPGSVDIICGGFPCQPFSTAGKRKGTEDDRYLWPEMLRVIREVKPAYVVGENVAGLVSMEDGGTLDRILTDLETEGYQTESFIIPACSVGAWHKRYRVWIVSYASDFRDQVRVDTRRNSSQKGGSEEVNELQREAQTGERVWGGLDRVGEDVPNTNSKRQESVNILGSNAQQEKWTNGRNVEVLPDLQRTRQPRQGEYEQSMYSEKGGKGQAVNVISGRRPDQWATEPELGRVANGLPDRVDRIKALGNAIVPQVAYEIFKAIQCIG